MKWIVKEKKLRVNELLDFWQCEDVLSGARKINFLLEKLDGINCE